MSKISLVPVRNGDECQIFADIFPDELKTLGLSAEPVAFTQRRIYEADRGPGLVSIPLEDAKKFAEEILKL